MRSVRQRRAWRNWPRLRRRRRGRLHIACRVMTVGRWLLLRRVVTTAVRVLGFVMLASSVMGAWAPMVADFARGTPWIALLEVFAWTQDTMRYVFTERWPRLGHLIWHHQSNGYDLHLGVLSVVVLKCRYIIGGLISTGLCLLLRPIFVKKLRVTISPDRVRVGGFPLGWTITRDDNGIAPIRFRVVSADEYHSRFRPKEIKENRLLKPLQEMPPAVVEIVHGFQRRKLLYVRRADQAEAIVARCNEAMLRTRRLLPQMAG